MDGILCKIRMSRFLMEISLLILPCSLIFFLLGIISPMGYGVFLKELGPRMCSYFMHCDRRIVFPGGLGFLYFHHGECYLHIT